MIHIFMLVYITYIFSCFYRSRSRDRGRDRKRDDSREKMTEEEREKDRERRKRGLPPIVRDKLSGTYTKDKRFSRFLIQIRCKKIKCTLL